MTDEELRLLANLCREIEEFDHEYSSPGAVRDILDRAEAAIKALLSRIGVA